MTQTTYGFPDILIGSNERVLVMHLAAAFSPCMDAIQDLTAIVPWLKQDTALLTHLTKDYRAEVDAAKWTLCQQIRDAKRRAQLVHLAFTLAAAGSVAFDPASNTPGYCSTCGTSYDITHDADCPNTACPQYANDAQLYDPEPTPGPVESGPFDGEDLEVF